MRRRRDQSDAGRRVSRARDDLIDLVSGKLPTFPRLRALRDLDLELARADEIPRRLAEPSRRVLLDRAVALRSEACRIFAAFSRVAATTNAIHRDGERFVRLTTDRAE